MYYKALRVKPAAAVEEIRASYRRLALTAHPDKGGSNDQFRSIQRAYEVLCDTVRRGEYDAECRRKRECRRRSARPAALAHVTQPAAYALADGQPYIFETASHVLRCGIECGDIIAWQGQEGSFIGLAQDDWLYWCREGESYACPLCQRDSSMALSSIQVVRRNHLHSMRVFLRPPTRPPTRHPASCSSWTASAAPHSTAAKSFSACCGSYNASSASTQTAKHVCHSRSARASSSSRHGSEGTSEEGAPWMSYSERVKQELRRREMVRMLHEALIRIPSVETKRRCRIIESERAAWADLCLSAALQPHEEEQDEDNNSEKNNIIVINNKENKQLYNTRRRQPQTSRSPSPHDVTETTTAARGVTRRSTRAHVLVNFVTDEEEEEVFCVFTNPHPARRRMVEEIPSLDATTEEACEYDDPVGCTTLATAAAHSRTHAAASTPCAHNEPRWMHVTRRSLSSSLCAEVLSEVSISSSSMTLSRRVSSASLNMHDMDRVDEEESTHDTSGTCMYHGNSDSNSSIDEDRVHRGNRASQASVDARKANHGVVEERSLPKARGEASSSLQSGRDDADLLRAHVDAPHIHHNDMMNDKMNRDEQGGYVCSHQRDTSDAYTNHNKSNHNNDENEKRQSSPDPIVVQGNNNINNVNNSNSDVGAINVAPVQPARQKPKHIFCPPLENMIRSEACETPLRAGRRGDANAVQGGRSASASVSVSAVRSAQRVSWQACATNTGVRSARVLGSRAHAKGSEPPVGCSTIAAVRVEQSTVDHPSASKRSALSPVNKCKQYQRWGALSVDELYAEELGFMNEFMRKQRRTGRALRQ